MGNIENGKFIFEPSEVRRLGRDDCGYAAQTWSDAPNNRRVKIWWNRWDGIAEKGARRCSMSAPCDISLMNFKGKEKLSAKIVPEIYNAFKNVRSANFKSGDLLTEESTMLLEIEPESSFELNVNGAEITAENNRIIVCGKEYLTESAPRKITVFRDGLNLQIHAEENTFMVIAGHVPSSDETRLVSGNAKITVFTL